MPPRDPELPEGTDQIVDGEEDGRRAFVASGGNGDGSARDATDRLVRSVKEQAASLRDQATDKLRGYADDGKGRATGLLDDVSSIIEDAAKSIDERLGAEYGDYAHRAANAVSSFASNVRDKTIDDLIDDTRSVVRKSPGVAIAAAAVIGFALIRVVRTGLDDAGAGNRRRNRSDGGKSREA